MLQKYSVANDVVSLVGDATEVKRKVQYVTASSVYEASDEDLVANGGETQVTKKEYIDGLIANGNFAEADRANLDALPEGVLFKINGKAVQTTTPPAPPVPEKSTTEWINTIPDPRVRSVLTNAIAAENQQRSILVEKILKSPANTFERKDLESSPLTNLTAIARFVPDEPAANDYSPLVGAGAQPVANFAGAAGAAPPATNNPAVPQNGQPAQGKFLNTRRLTTTANGAAK
jgi:hypothetical protein